MLLLVEQCSTKTTSNDFSNRRFIQQCEVRTGSFNVLADEEYHSQLADRSRTFSLEDEGWLHHLQQHGPFLQYQEHTRSTANDGRWGCSRNVHATT